MADLTQKPSAAAMRLAITVIMRLPEAVYLRRKTARIGAWMPARHQCHDNVAYWVERNPHHKHVFGFLYFDWRLATGCIRLSAHSAVEDEQGTLCDITPHDASADYPFIRHVGTADDFALIAALVHIDVPAR